VKRSLKMPKRKSSSWVAMLLAEADDREAEEQIEETGHSPWVLA
jgi:hypothetical protein